MHTRRRFARIATFVVPLLGGCVQASLREWGRDEVVVHGLATRTAEDERERRASLEQDLSIDVQNVDGLEDGTYSISIGCSSVMPPSHDGPDGVRQLDEPAIGGLRRSESNHRLAHWADPWHVAEEPAPFVPPRLDEASLAHPDARWERERNGKGGFDRPPELGTRLTRSDERDYELEIFAFDDDAKRWVRVGRLVIGRGTQSPALRKTAVVCLYPLAIVLDVVLTPFAWFDNQERHGCCLGPIPL